MTEADTQITPIEWKPLTEVYRYALSELSRPPEEIKSLILDDIAIGNLPHKVDRIIRHLPRSPRAPTVISAAQDNHYSPTGALWSRPKIKVEDLPWKPPASPPVRYEVELDGRIPPEVLVVGVAGRGSLHTSWMHGNAVRRAGSTWLRIELEGIKCSWEHVLALYRRPTAPSKLPGKPGKLWIKDRYDQERERYIREGTGITDAARELAKESQTTADCAKPLGLGYIKNELRLYWHTPKRQQFKQRPK